LALTATVIGLREKATVIPVLTSRRSVASRASSEARNGSG
jgi:hypothetical protein